MAKTINLYDQPKMDGKIVGTVDSTTGIIAIFTPKEGGWMKVADPRNGDVGWIKLTDLGNVGFTVNVMSTGDGSHGYQVFQYGNTKPYTPEQLREIELRQQAIQKNMQKMMEDIYKNIQQQWSNLPAFMPILVIPQPQKTTTHQKTSPSNKN